MTAFQLFDALLNIVQEDHGHASEPVRVFGAELGDPVVIGLKNCAQQRAVGPLEKDQADAGVDDRGVDAVQLVVFEECLGLIGTGHDRVPAPRRRRVPVLGAQLAELFALIELVTVLGLDQGAGRRLDEFVADPPLVQDLAVDHVGNLVLILGRGAAGPQIGRFNNMTVGRNHLVRRWHDAPPFLSGSLLRGGIRSKRFQITIARSELQAPASFSTESDHAQRTAQPV